MFTEKFKKIITIVTLYAFSLSISTAAFTPEVSPYHPWRGCRVAYFGDSITDPDICPGQPHYWEWLSRWLGTESFVYAIAGRTWSDIPSQTQRLEQEHGDDFDAIMIFIGTNDYIGAVPLGQWYETDYSPTDFGLGAPKAPTILKHRTLSMDSDTYRGRINIAMSRLRARYHDKQILLLTPIHRAYFSCADDNCQPDESYANRIGLFIDDYVSATVEAGSVWSVPVINLYTLSGLYPMADSHGRYFNDSDTDRLHPNGEGHRRIALTLLNQLSAIPGRL